MRSCAHHQLKHFKWLPLVDVSYVRKYSDTTCLDPRRHDNLYIFTGCIVIRGISIRLLVLCLSSYVTNPTQQ